MPWDKILLYIQYQGFDDEVATYFKAVIKKLDFTYLKWRETKKETDSG